MCILCRVRVTGTPVTLVQLDSGDLDSGAVYALRDSMHTVGPLTKLVIASRLERAQN
jgi:hypothetical protein